jgi:cadmium resistance protein CadD (predicted permease)
LAISELFYDHIAELVGALLGVFLGYLLGFKQQRKIDSEKDQKKRKELMQALKAELVYLVGEVTRKSSGPSAFFGSLNFDTIFLDLPTFTRAKAP